ncbi:MAG: flippase [Candidatus Omnitrophica bacterium]|nr:flippase [Candidatus Omnitrophota bacterium]
MFNKFSADKRRLASNFFSLSSIEAANYLLPLITVPYLVRVLGPGKYGLIAFAAAFIQYFVMFTDYGFQLTATRAISVARDDAEKVSRIFSTVMLIKAGIMLLSFTAVLAIIYFIPKFRQDALLYIFAFGMVAGDVLFPVWFFQGMERMKFIAALNLLARTIFVLAIFLFIRKEQDYIYAPLITSAGVIIAGLVSMWMVFTRFSVRFIMPSGAEITRQVKEGWNVFVSMISISLITTSNTFILGFFAPLEAVGFYSAAEKIILIANKAFNPILVAVYPHIAKTAATARDIAIIKLRKLFVLVMTFSFAAFALIFIFSGVIVSVILGPKFGPSVAVLRILSPLAFIVPVAYIFANLGLLPFKLDRYFAGIYIFGGILNLSLLITLLYYFKAGAEGAAVSVLITQVVITTLMYAALRRNGIKIVNMDVPSLLAVFNRKAIVDN